MIKSSAILVATDTDPDIHVIGYGILSLSQAKKKIRSYVEDMNKCLAKDDFHNLAYYAYSNGVLKALIEAVNKAEPRWPD